MKIMIASDIHGGELFARQLTEAFERESCDRMILLGDLLHHGHSGDFLGENNPPLIAEILNRYADRIIAVRGNCDTDEEIGMLDFPVEEKYIVFKSGGLKIFAAHGHLCNPDRLPPDFEKGNVILCGHTHIPAMEERYYCVYVNPGSVSLPKQDSSRGYIVLEDGYFVRKTFDGEIEAEFTPGKTE